MDFMAGAFTTGSRRRVGVVLLAAMVVAVTMAIAAPAQAAPNTAKAWGLNTSGQLGDGTSTGPEKCEVETEACSTIPVAVNTLTGVIAVAGGHQHSLALLQGGTVMAWGANGQGQLGNGTESGSTVPVAVKELSGVRAVAAGAGHSLALLQGGTVMAWGGNESGQLGNGTTKSSVVPVAVSELREVTAVAAGGRHSLALLSNGTVMAWGGNESGQLGNGTAKSSAVAVAVSELKGVTAISAGSSYSLALLSNGTVMAWGDNRLADLGNGTTTNSNVPVEVSKLSGVSAISAGEDHSLALLNDGTVTAWGENKYGELGNGTSMGPEKCGSLMNIACSRTPVAVSGLSGVGAVSAGDVHSLALRKDGTVDAWGQNSVGQLGSGSSVGPELCGVATCSTKPVEVSKLLDVKGIAAGGKHSLAFGPPPTVTNVNPSHGSPSGGTTVTIDGTDFTGASAVKFGSTNVTSFTVNSATSITAVSPAGTGVVDVTVTNTWGTSATSAADRFSYEPPPTVTGVEPNHGPAAGGTSVTITGTNLTGTSAVKFGSTNAASFKVNSDTSLTAVSPAGTGAVDVTVTTPSGTSATSPGDRFTYGPTVTKVEPNHGSPSGGTTVTITGTGFTGATAVRFGASNAATFTVNSATSVTAVSPKAMGALTVDVTVTTPAGTSPTSSADQFTYMKK
jgi:alpha-tubulin suppressor-like RCC1 family protein